MASKALRDKEKNLEKNAEVQKNQDEKSQIDI